MLPYKSCTYFTRTGEWYLATFKRAVSACNRNFSLELEWYDEEEILLNSTEKELAEKLANRRDIFAIVGPLSNSCVKVFAEACFTSKKPLFAPVASSENLIRSFAINTVYYDKKTPFLWSLSETDISQCEALLTKMYSSGGRSLSLLCGADMYGRTFYDWVPFLASDFNLELKQSVRYTSEHTGDSSGLTDWGNPAVALELAVDSVMASGADYVLCALSSHKDIAAVLTKRKSMGDRGPKLLFTSASLTSLVLENPDAEGIEGIAMYADPETGFSVAYKARFGDSPCVGEAQFYDALAVCGFAAAKSLQKESFNPSSITNSETNGIITELLTEQEGADVKSRCWSVFGMSEVFRSISENLPVNIGGASGNLLFDEGVLTSVSASVYVHWCIAEGDFVFLDFTSRQGTTHTQAHKTSWEWAVLFDGTYQDIIAGSGSDGTVYGNLTSQWAVIVAASSGWYNYRHQADALYIYQLLKKNGYDDEHILLIMADDIAFDSHNKKPGEMYARLQGENLYTDVQIDYNISDLTVKDLQEIILGNHLTGFPEGDVLASDAGSNILWFWTGHGNNIQGSAEKGLFCWSGKELTEYAGFTTALMKDTLEQMAEGERYRQLLILTETCYSASVMHVADGIPGVLAITAANGIESSLADIYSVDLGVWLSNRFTYNVTVQLEIESESLLRFSDFYKYLAQNTIGSHVTIFNAAKFQNLNEAYLQDFFTYNVQ